MLPIRRLPIKHSTNQSVYLAAFYSSSIHLKKQFYWLNESTFLPNNQSKFLAVSLFIVAVYKPFRQPCSHPHNHSLRVIKLANVNTSQSISVNEILVYQYTGLRFDYIFSMSTSLEVYQQSTSQTVSYKTILKTYRTLRTKSLQFFLSGG